MIKNLYKNSNNKILSQNTFFPTFTFYLFFFFLIFFSVNVNAQNSGGISGIVADKNTNEKLIGANILVLETSRGTSTDIDGNYSIKNLKPGNYELRFSYISYQTLLVKDVIVKAGKTTNVKVSLVPAVTELNEIVVSAEALKSTENAVLRIQKNAVNILDGVSAELIAKNNSSNGTDILKRISGVTIAEDKYAYIRGIGDRYNNTLLNGANLPSTDPEKKSFSYDIFPANLIQNIITLKTFTANKPADFSGGLVEINTIEFPSKFVLNLSASLSYAPVTSLHNFDTYNGGNTDVWGMDDGTRGMPSDINSTKVLRGNYSNSELQKIALSFKNNWQTKQIKAPFNSNYKFSIGDKIDLFSNTLGYLGAVTYSKKFSSNLLKKNNYTFDGPRYLYNGNVYTESVDLGALLNISYKIGGNSKISFKNIFNQSSDDETTEFEGEYMYSDQYRKITSLRFVSRSLLSNQLIGEHHINFLNGLNIGWNFSYANSHRNEPDARRYVYARDLLEPADSLNPFRFQLDQSVSTRFFGKLDDHNYEVNTDFTLKPFENPDMPTIKTGFDYNKKNRTFDARIFGFKNAFGGNFLHEDSVLQKPVQDIFVPENINPSFIEVTEITKPSDSYTSNQFITAGYIMFDTKIFSKLRAVAGVRFEKSNQELNSKSETNEPVKVSNTYNDWLPSLNLAYFLNDKINLRFALSQTLARPEFRELAPYSYFDFTANEIVKGNPELKRSLIQNYDLRFEIYPSHNELLAVSFFFKRFKAPIEQILISSSAFEPIRSFENGNDASNYGIEIELRKSLMFVSEYLNHFTFIGNTSLIKSEIKIGDHNSKGFQRDTRPMQGQADYIMNFGLYYDNYDTGLSAGIIYNKVGERISKVGFGGLGDIIEMPRDQIDFTVSHKIFEYFALKFSVKDLLAQDRIFIQRMPGSDKIAQREKRSSNFSIGLSYQF